jgi:hypothetical protein
VPVNETSHNNLRKLLTFTAIVEFGTGLVALIDPAILITLLLGLETSNAGTLLGRFFGIALISLSLACWPGRQENPPAFQPFRGILLYNAVVALYLAYLGAIAHIGGPLLWPAVALHAVVALLLIWARRDR